MPSKRRRRIRGPWRKLYAAAFNDLKVNLLAKKLCLPHLHAFGCTAALWAVVPPGGHIAIDKIDGLERQMRWEGEEGALLEALLDVELLEFRDDNEGYALHNNEEHGGSFAEAQRQANKRARAAEAEPLEQKPTRPPPMTANQRQRLRRLVRDKGMAREEALRLVRGVDSVTTEGGHVTPDGDRDGRDVTRDIRDSARDVTEALSQNADSVENSARESRCHVTVLAPLRGEEKREDLRGGEIARAREELTVSQLQTEMANTMGFTGIPPRYHPALNKLEREGKLFRETVEYVWRDTAARKAAEGVRPNVNYFCQALVNEASRTPVEAPTLPEGAIPLGQGPGAPWRGAQRVEGRRGELSGGMRCVQRGVVLAQAILATDRTK